MYCCTLMYVKHSVFLPEVVYVYLKGEVDTFSTHFSVCKKNNLSLAYLLTFGFVWLDSVQIQSDKH